MPQELLGPSADALARLHTAEALGSLVSVLRSPASKPADVINAANSLLDRGHGKATQAIITVPARRATAARLAALTDDQLLIIASARRAAEEGSTPQTRGPNAQGTGRIPLAAPLGKLGEAGGTYPGTTGDDPRGTSHEVDSNDPQADDFDEQTHFEKLFALNQWPEDRASSVLGSREPADGFATSPLAVNAKRAPGLPFGLKGFTEASNGGVPSERGDPPEHAKAAPSEFPAPTKNHKSPPTIDPLS